MSQRPGITYMPFASTTSPRSAVAAEAGPALTMRLPSTTMDDPPRSAPLETSTMVAFVIVSVCADRRGVAVERATKSAAANRVMCAVRDRSCQPMRRILRYDPPDETDMRFDFVPALAIGQVIGKRSADSVTLERNRL